MTDDLDLAGLARELHRSIDWTRRHWRGLVRDQGMPAPFFGGQAYGRPCWLGFEIRAWKNRVVTGGDVEQPKTPHAREAANDQAPVAAPRHSEAAVRRLLQAAGGA